jgi:phosphonate transport system substrate-binding protein
MKLGIWNVALALALSAPARADDRPLKIGLAAMISPKETLTYYNGLLGYVGQRLGRRVEMVQYRTYGEMDLALERRDVEIAFLCSGPYVRDRARFGAELLAAPQAQGKPVYYAHVIVPAASPARTLADLRGKTFVFTDPLSHTGRAVPSYLVEKEFGIPAERFFSSISFTGSHDRSIEEVAKGTVDGASVDSLIYDYLAARFPAKTRGTRVLWTSPPYGIPPVVVHPRIDPVLRSRVQEALLLMHDDPRGKAILENIRVERFVIARDADYDSVRDVERWLERHPSPVRAPGPARRSAAVPAAARP